MKHIFNKLLAGISTFLVITLAHAGVPLWTFTPLTPTSISISGTQTTPVLIKYQVTNQSRKPHTLIMTPIQGVFQDTSNPGSCSKPFILMGGQSCTLTLSVIGNLLTDNVSTGPMVCQQGNPLQCYQPSINNSLKIVKGTSSPSLVYVSDSTQQLWQCPVNTFTGGLDGTCVALTNVPPFSYINNAVFQPFNSNTYAYVSDYTATLWQCPINTSTGTFNGTCTALTNSPAFSNTLSATFQTFNGSTYAYVSDFSSNLWQCPINTATGALSGACTALTNSPAFSGVLNVVFQTFNGSTYAYVSDNTSNLWQCPVNTSTGAFSGACVALTNSPAFATTNSVTFQSFNSSTYVYVSDYSSTLWKCPIDTSTGAFSGSCTALTNTPAFIETGSIVFQSFNGSTYGYVGDYSTKLWQCPMNTATGAFNGPCTALTNSPAFFSTAAATFQ